MTPMASTTMSAVRGASSFSSTLTRSPLAAKPSTCSPDAAAPPFAAAWRGGRRPCPRPGGQQLAGPLDHGDVDAQLPQVFHQLQADEAAAGQHRGPGMVLFDEFRIFRVSSTVRRVNRRSILRRGSAGWGAGTGERTSLS